MPQLNGTKSHTVGLDSSVVHDPSEKTSQEKTFKSLINTTQEPSFNNTDEEINGSHKTYQNQTQKQTDPAAFLKMQIDSLETNEDYEAKLRYESEAYILSKRRNYLFRPFERWDEDEEKLPKEEGAIIFDQQISRKKMSTKNSIKIQKLLNSFLTKNYPDEQRTSQHLDFISNKHKIALEMINNNNSYKKQPNTTNNQIGYKQNDIRKVKKYQINLNKLPVLGLEYDLEDKNTLPEINEQELKNDDKNTIADVYEEGLNCFENKTPQKGYVLPDEPLKLQFLDSKRQIFKLSRQFIRQKQQREAQCKKLAHLCMKEVEKKYLKSIKVQNQNVLRAKKLHRQCLIYWRKREKQLTEVKKKKEKLQAQLKKRQEQEQQAKKQQKRLQYIMYQSGLYSHFMATKLGMDADHQKQLQKSSIPNSNNIEIDEQAAQLTVNQIINSKQENLQKFAKPQQKLDLSSVDQGKLSELVSTPVSFQGTLKEYQIKGLRWLNNLFEQGINGILADEMGLGKTIQAISLLAHVSHTKNIWGPFLIVAPNSTLFNWQQQFKKFCPSLRVLPYWGNIKQRKTLRKFFSPKKFTQRPDSPFHVVITSYQLTVTDDKVFKKMKWQFMILDEAQAIKNVLSQRWNTLKEFQSRNRLLLTGTPIQNNMAQLWALLNFVMPDLFDSHELFNEWFSKDIEAHSQDAKQLDQIKIQRLHAILKPFMLRRVKKDVEHQIGKKIQHQILCQMTKRQKLLYDSIKQKLNVKELFKMFESKAKVENLMNLVMQLRKVCNHPELFERRPAISPFLFQDMYYYTGYIPIKAGDIKLLSFNSKNPIQIEYPKLAYDEFNKYQINPVDNHKRLLNIFTFTNQSNNPTFSITHLFGLSKSQVQLAFRQDPLFTAILVSHWLKQNSYNKGFSTKQNFNIFSQFSDKKFTLDRNPLFYRDIDHGYIPAATAPSIEMNVASNSFVNNSELIKQNKFLHFVLYGHYKERFEHYFKYNAGSQFIQDYKGLLHRHPSLTKIEVINFGNLIADSSKLKQLDRILKEKKRNGDKVLIFCQMTKMIDILEDFMNMKKYSFFRLDGACNISDRRDMVNEFQKSTSKTFVFLLSTRAGGLGVTLTAANTVIFYDNDWNPTMDAQATDRAHRIGQSSDVNVYQLVTKGTIQQRIVKRAQQKKNVQSTVYEGASFNFFKKDMILELMVDQFDENGNEEKSKKDGKQKKKGKPPKARQEGHLNGHSKNIDNKENEIMRKIENKQRSQEIRNDFIENQE